MWFFKRKSRVERKEDFDKKEEEINAIKEDTLSTAIATNAKLELLNEMIEKSPDDVALRFFAATGGDKRMGK